MGLREILKSGIREGRYKREDEIKIIGRDEDIEPTKYCTAAREDVLCYFCFDASSIRRDVLSRQIVEQYLGGRFPGFDSPDFYIDTLIEICDRLGVGRTDLIAAQLLSDRGLNALLLYEKKGHYFTSDDWKGYDITSLIEENLQKMIGIRDRKNKKGYRVYIIFTQENGGN